MSITSDITPARPSAQQSFGYSGLDVDAQRPGRVIVTTIERWNGGDEIFLSDDFGATWTPLNPRSTFDASTHPWLQAYQARRHDKPGHWMADFKIDPHDGNRSPGRHRSEARCASLGAREPASSWHRGARGRTRAHACGRRG